MEPYIFNIDFNRAGTTSLTEALNILGIKTLHFSTDGTWWFPNNKNEIERIMADNYYANRPLLHGFDEDVRGFSDFAGIHFFKILYEQYPNSKFILTTRAVEDWVNSVLYMEKDQGRLETIDIENVRRSKLTERYFHTKKEIKDFFKDKPNCYLEIDIIGGEGWEVLCNFLGKNIPNVPFPHLNKQKYNV